MSKIHETSLNAILLGEIPEGKIDNIRSHIKACDRCKIVLRKSRTPLGEQMLEYLHPTENEILLYVHPERDTKKWLTKVGRQVLTHHFTKCSACRDIRDAEKTFGNLN